MYCLRSCEQDTIPFKAPFLDYSLLISVHTVRSIPWLVLVLLVLPLPAAPPLFSILFLIAFYLAKRPWSV